MLLEDPHRHTCLGRESKRKAPFPGSPGLQGKTLPLKAMTRTLGQPA